MAKLQIITTLLLWMSAVNAEYLFTMPRQIERGYDTRFCLSLTGLDRKDGGKVFFRVQLNFTDENNVPSVYMMEFSSSSSTVPDIFECPKLFSESVPPPISGSYKLNVKGLQQSGPRELLLFNATKEVRIVDPQLISLVQTDKPIYKPGQTVKFRAMTMDHKLMSKTDGFSEIVIESPSGMRMMQWDDVPADNGLVSLEMPLSEDPVLGDWKIRAQPNGNKETVTLFKVDEYVLPKYEVTITPPKYLLPTTPKIKINVCAKYTYGKPVKGNVKMDICFKASYQSSYYDVRPCTTISDKINGCQDFYVNADELKLGHRGYQDWGTLRVNASVTEAATGIELNKQSEGPGLSRYPLSLTIEDDSSGYFKPGFPYKARVIVKNPDDTPAIGEEIKVMASSHYYRQSNFMFTKTFMSDENGIVNFVLTELLPDMDSFSLQAEAVVYRTDWRYTDNELFFRTYTPSAYKSVNKFHSPSNSFIYIPDVDGAQECGAELNLDVFYTSPPDSKFVFLAMVKAGDRIAHTTYTTQHSGTPVTTDRFKVDQEQLLEKTEIPTTTTVEPPIIDPYPPEPYPYDDLEPVQEEVIVPEQQPLLGQADGEGARRKKTDVAVQSISHFTLPVTITPDMSPNVKVLVYYTRDDNEIVASTVDVNIKGCFKNKVEMEVPEGTVKPGSTVSIGLTASPNSTCFVGMVDKSVNLLGGDNQLTPAKVFENVGRVARPYSYWVSHWMEDNEYCQEQIGTPDSKDETFYYNQYRPDGADSSTAFRDANMWVVTDGVLQSRPCTEYPMVYYMRTGSGSRGPVALPQSVESPEIMRKGVGTTGSGTIRSYFPETWLWDIVTLGESFEMDGAMDGEPEIALSMEGPSKGSVPKPPIGGSGSDDSGTVRRWRFVEAYVEMLSSVSCKFYIVSVDRGMPGSRGLPGGRQPIPLDLVDDSNSLGIPERQEVSQPSAQETSTVEVRSYFPESWLWSIVPLGETGSDTLETTIPDTITEWVGNTLCTSPADGVGVTEVTGVTAFKPFFVSLTLPYSAVRGETLPVVVTVFNYLEECLAMEAVMEQSEGFNFPVGTVNSRQFCLCGGLSESFTVNIIPLIIGEVDIQVQAVSIDDTGMCNNQIVSTESVGATDGVQRQLLVEAEGVPQDLTESNYECVGENEEMNTVFNLKAALPDNLVPGSERAVVSVVGDIMGPTLSNLKNLLRMPYGCGEQNMASWTPNIFVLQYLSNTGQLKPDLEEEAKRFMRVGYQRQMKYRHNDGSYSAWGENQHGNATGSIWLTAFVVKAMAQSAPYITIDKRDLAASAIWFAAKQLDNGCFPQVGQVFSSYMKGGLADGDNPAGLTAFILAAMLEAKLGPEFMESIDKGFKLCMESFPISDTDTYTLALMGYAYSLYDIKNERRLEIMEELDNRKKEESGLINWRREGEQKPSTDYGYWYRAPSAEVEMTSYVLTALLANGPHMVGSVQPIVQWLSKQRNPYGGFSSTQDTVVALHALANFALLTYSGETELNVSVRNRDVDKLFTITPDNSLLYQSVPVDPADGLIKLKAEGIGCALVQTNLKYNIYKEKKTGPAFKLKVRPLRSRYCADRNLEICTSYLKPGGVSNMAIVEVKMPTGWAPELESLKELVKSDQIQKFEVEKNYVELYFDQIAKRPQCIVIGIHQDIVMTTMDALVKVYDYYETDYTVTTTYGIKTTCGTKAEIPLDNEGLDCSIMQCRATSPPLTCPVCMDKYPKNKEDFAKMACDSKVVYKGIVGRRGTYPGKIKASIRTRKKKVLDTFVTYNLPPRCSCPILDGKDVRVLIFTNEASLDSDNERLYLDDATTILKWSRKFEKGVRIAASRRRFCEKIERSRRSKAKRLQRKQRRQRKKRT